jgi:putative ABC transport system substrate-binding protein
MRRREFITVFGGATLAWPLVARAQQAERVRRIGVLTAFARSDPEAQAWVAPFREGLQEFGWAEGRNIRIDTRWGGAAEGHSDAHRVEKRCACPVQLCPWRSYCASAA